MPGVVFFVGAGPGDPELITVKGKKLIDSADLIIYAGSLVNPEIFKGTTAGTVDSSALTLDELTALIQKWTEADKTVVRLHTGDLSFYSAISEQIERLTELQIKYEVVPGVSSLAAASAALRQELTIPEISQSVIITRLEGNTPVPERERLSSLATHNATLVIFLSISMIERVAEELLKGGYKDSTPVVVVERASWPTERIIRATLSDIALKVTEAGIKKTALILVGEALSASDSPTGKKSKLYDAGFSHGCRK
ncbi:MAG: precorrin-4 C(11)-methyltransferase [Nitrospirae bacterium]|nr:precorrin-4 C(11)-methyltransferase [Nitrospirota bacterium]MBF0533663.1 precorrin-4 C(11)-methyltransferase [Nitrospirota bacterium]MBF0616686.1 precorrin-4 C(11)-methyltransferase [Nitrospirota bacterium]